MFVQEMKKLFSLEIIIVITKKDPKVLVGFLYMHSPHLRAFQKTLFSEGSVRFFLLRPVVVVCSSFYGMKPMLMSRYV